jgi:hypothetical protein
MWCDEWNEKSSKMNRNLRIRIDGIVVYLRHKTNTGQINLVETELSDVKPNANHHLLPWCGILLDLMLGWPVRE